MHILPVYLIKCYCNIFDNISCRYSIHNLLWLIRFFWNWNLTNFKILYSFIQKVHLLRFYHLNYVWNLIIIYTPMFTNKLHDFLKRTCFADTCIYIYSRYQISVNIHSIFALYTYKQIKHVWIKMCIQQPLHVSRGGGAGPPGYKLI